MNSENPYESLPDDVVEISREYPSGSRRHALLTSILALASSGGLYYGHMWCIRRFSRHDLGWSWLPATAIALGVGLSILTWLLGANSWKSVLVFLFVPTFILTVVLLEFIVWPGWI